MAAVRKRTKSITAQNTFSDAISLKSGGQLILTGTWTATVTVQEYDEGSAAWVDVTNNSGTAFTATANGTYSIAPGGFSGKYRFGVKTGGFTSGTVVGTITGR